MTGRFSSRHRLFTAHCPDSSFEKFYQFPFRPAEETCPESREVVPRCHRPKRTYCLQCLAVWRSTGYHKAFWCRREGSERMFADCRKQGRFRQNEMCIRDRRMASGPSLQIAESPLVENFQPSLNESIFESSPTALSDIYATSTWSTNYGMIYGT